MIKELLIQIKTSPAIKTAIFIISVIVSGILCSAFVTEIALNGKLDWMYFYKATSFYLILIYSAFLYFYNRIIYIHEKDVLKFLDDDYCKAYIIQECLPQLVEKYKRDLKSNKNPSNFIDIREELKKLNK